MRQKTWALQLFVTLAVLATVLLFFEITSVDLAIQDQLFLGRPHRWIVDAKNPVGRLFFYKGIKVLLVTSGVLLLFAYIISLKRSSLRPYRKSLLLMLLSMALVPIAAATLKNTTNVYWPDQLERYGGDKPYVKVFESYPPGYVQTQRGYGFPAGHAAGGFSLMALFFVFSSKRLRLVGLSIGLGVGWAMGFYQMAKGAHFLSHTVVTMVGAWLIILIIYRVVDDDLSAFAQEKTEVAPMQRAEAQRLQTLIE